MPAEAQFNAGRLSNLQVTTQEALVGNLSTSDHLERMFATERHKLGRFLSYELGGRNVKNGKFLMQFLTGGLGNEIFTESEEFSWDLILPQIYYGEVIKDATEVEPNNEFVGRYHTVFRVVMKDKVFNQRDIIYSDKNIDITCQVCAEPVPYSAGGWMYSLVISNADKDLYLTKDAISTGAKWSRDFTAVEELSTKVESGRAHTSAMFVNNLTTIRTGYSVSAKLAMQKMIIEIPDSEGKFHKKWINYADWQNMIDFQNDFENLLFYGNPSFDQNGLSHLKGKNGKVIKIGAGVRSQISDSMKHFYKGSFTYDFWDEILLDMSYQVQRNGGNHNFVAFTGKMGMRKITEMVNKKWKGMVTPNFISNDARFLDGKGQEMQFLGMEFQTIHFPNGIKLTVKELPAYDEMSGRGLTRDPLTNKPIESSRFTLMNFGTADSSGTKNIRKVTRKSSERMWYTGGSIDPMGIVSNSKSKMGSTDIDGYELHRITEGGVIITDPTQCCEIIMKA
jgi:hypothetical protein